MMFSTAGNYLGNYVGNLKLKFGHFGFGDRSAECVFKRAWDHGKVECHSFSSAGASGSERRATQSVRRGQDENPEAGSMSPRLYKKERNSMEHGNGRPAQRKR